KQVTLILILRPPPAAVYASAELPRGRLGHHCSGVSFAFHQAVPRQNDRGQLRLSSATSFFFRATAYAPSSSMMTTWRSTPRSSVSSRGTQTWLTLWSKVQFS
ncbi:unnamed protein product, partial [Musa acuminata var. zebrina]